MITDDQLAKIYLTYSPDARFIKQLDTTIPVYEHYQFKIDTIWEDFPLIERLDILSILIEKTKSGESLDDYIQKKFLQKMNNNS